MEWFTGSIPEAIRESRQKGLVFIVYIEGWYYNFNLFSILRGVSLTYDLIVYLARGMFMPNTSLIQTTTFTWSIDGYFCVIFYCNLEY